MLRELAKSVELSEQEILKAKAEALGRAGEKLQRAAERYRRLKSAPGATSPQLAAALDDIVQAREVLIVLREGIGLYRHEIIDEQYDLPFANRAEHSR